ARRRALLRVPGAGGRGVRARVLIRPKAGILDPQGQAVERALPALGFEGVRNVHVGRLVELDAQKAASRVGEAVLLWHRDHDLQGVDAVIVPGGFSYGDYLRAGALARFAPVMDEVIRFARSGGPVLGICNGFQVLCEAGLLPGALLPNVGLRFRCLQVGVEVLNADTVWTRACEPGEL